MLGVWFLRSKKKDYCYFSKRKGKYFYTFNIFKCDELASHFKGSKFLALLFLLYWDKILTKTKILTNQRIPLKKILPKNPPKKILPKNFSKKINPKKSAPKKSSRKIPKEISIKIPKSSKQYLKKILRFWKYPIPYIALRGRKSFRACCSEKSSKRAK